MSWRINKEKMHQSKPMSPDLSPKDDYQEVLTEASARAYNYLRTIQERDVGVSQEALDKLPLLGGPLPRSGEDPQSILQLLDEIGSPATMATTGGRFFGGVIGGDRKSTRLNSSHLGISYAVFCLKKKK